MSKHFRYFFLFSFIVLIVSCKKKTPEDIGLPILPGEDLLHATITDTCTLITHTVKDDSLLTGSSTVKLMPILLGCANDPIFGASKASIYTQFSLSKTNPDFGTNPQLDSAVLSLAYNSGQYYGTLYPQSFQVFEIADQMYKDTSYFSNRTLQAPTQLGAAYFAPRPNPATDSVMAEVKYPPHLRITLNKTFFQAFLDNPTYTATFNTNSNFQSVFKGLYVTASTAVPNEGAILYMDLKNTYSRITLYYHNSTDTTSYFFGISQTDCARFSNFVHD